MTDQMDTATQQDIDAARERASAKTDPATGPGPRANPPVEVDSVARGREKLERVKPY
jgi:hypothetical protein